MNRARNFRFVIEVKYRNGLRREQVFRHWNFVCMLIFLFWKYGECKNCVQQVQATIIRFIDNDNHNKINFIA